MTRFARVGGHVVDLAALPIVTITTAGGAPVVSKVDYVSGTIAITGAGAVAEQAVQIRGRGNSTWEQPKKPYRLQLGTAASLVPGVAPDRAWVLLANYFDPAQIRTLIATQMALASPGLAWTPQFRPVQLTLNGARLGVYLLGEHVKIAPNRVAIDPMGSGDTAGLAVTGGYTLEIDYRGVHDDGDPGFTTTHGVWIAYSDPDGLVPAQAAYISGFVQDFENALYSADWLDPDIGYARFIDQASFIDWYLVNELCANQDSNFFSSCKLYKPRDTAQVVGRLHFGPIWDFDRSIKWDNRDPASYWTRTGAVWFDRMLDDPAFHAATQTRWAALRTRLAAPAGLDAFIDRWAPIIAQPAIRDQTLWGYTHDWDSGATELKTWLTTRMAWLAAVLDPDTATGYGFAPYGISPYGA